MRVGTQLDAVKYRPAKVHIGLQKCGKSENGPRLGLKDNVPGLKCLLATTSFSTTTMSDGRKRLSGAEYKKRAKKKLEEQEHVLKQTKRLDLFFKTPGEQEIAPVLEGPALDDSVDETAGQLDDNVSAGPRCSNPPANLASLNEDIIIPHEIATESLSLELLSPCCSSEDPAFWVLNDATRDSIAKNGFKQNIDLDFSNSVREYKDQNDIYPNLCFNEH
ncbi:hypothetical protein J6590_079057 [Homalodisca vitripennis]|nr:hypothetical protein J6590_079057 [Homalodisca vitripennis]